MSDEKPETREQRARRLRRNLEEAMRINDERMAEWPQWMHEAAALCPVFTAGRGGGR